MTDPQARAPKLSPVQGEAYRILRDRYPEEGRTELLELLTGAELEHEFERELGTPFHDCLLCQAITNLVEAGVLQAVVVECCDQDDQVVVS